MSFKTSLLLLSSYLVFSMSFVLPSQNRKVAIHLDPIHQSPAAPGCTELIPAAKLSPGFKKICRQKLKQLYAPFDCLRPDDAPADGSLAHEDSRSPQCIPSFLSPVTAKEPQRVSPLDGQNMEVIAAFHVVRKS